MTAARQLQFYPTFDRSLADCNACELKEMCDRGRVVFGVGPSKPFNGIMIIGEGPGQQEVTARRPFVGRAGMLLRQLLMSSGIDMDACYISNATCGWPPPGDKPMHERFPNAVHSCLPRLEAEIAHVKPRVILAFGNAALIALTGYETEYTKRVPFDCEACNNERKIGPVFVCAKCKAHSAVLPHAFEDAQCVDCGATDASKPCPPQACHACNASMKKLKPRMVKCSACNGLKTREQKLVSFDYDYSISEVAGMVIPAEKFNWHESGVKYIIPTFHPSFLLRPVKSEGSGEKKVMAGQFAAYAVQKHMQKALTLSKEDRPWSFEYDQTTGDGQEAADTLLSFLDDVLKTTEHELASDIETEAWGTAFYCNVCNKKTIETSEQCPTDAKYVEDLPCKNCKNEHGENIVTEHTLEPCEMDARELEEVTQIKCIGFASRVLRRAVVCDTRNMQIGSPLFNAIKHALQQEELGIVFHHGTYDVPVIRRLWGFPVTAYTNDTLIKHHETHADETHTLQHLVARYTFAPLWKPPKRKRGAVIHEDFDALCEYNARDCMGTAEASYALTIELHQEKMDKLNAIDMELQKQALDMQHNGMPLDWEIAEKIGARALKTQLVRLKEMREILGDPEFNPQAPKQLQKALYETLGNKVVDWTDGGKSGNRQPSTAKETLVKLNDSPFKRALLKYRDVNATLKAFYDILPDGKGGFQAKPGRGLNLWGDGRIHAVWKPFGTITGRFSSNPNCQNWPKWLRAIVKCAPGRKIVGADYDQLELRVLAMLCGDEELIHRCMTADDKRKYEANHDPHSFVGSHVFPQYTLLNFKDPRHIKVDVKDKLNALLSGDDGDDGGLDDVKCKCDTCLLKSLRDICKRVIYGLNYGASEDTVLEAIYNGGYSGPPISKADIIRVKATIFGLFPGILTWREEQVRCAQETRELRSTFMHRRREFALGDVPITEISNFPIQSTAADIVNERNTEFYALHKKIDPTAMYLAQIHDALYYEVAEDKAEEFAEIMSATLTCDRSIAGSAPMRFSASASIADNLKDAA